MKDVTLKAGSSLAPWSKLLRPPGSSRNWFLEPKDGCSSAGHQEVCAMGGGSVPGNPSDHAHQRRVGIPCHGIPIDGNCFRELRCESGDSTSLTRQRVEVPRSSEIANVGRAGQKGLPPLLRHRRDRVRGRPHSVALGEFFGPAAARQSAADTYRSQSGEVPCSMGWEARNFAVKTPNIAGFAQRLFSPHSNAEDVANIMGVMNLSGPSSGRHFGRANRGSP